VLGMVFNYAVQFAERLIMPWQQLREED
jgi:hypothetical protein